VTRPLALTGWSAVGPLGVGAEHFGAAVRGGGSGLRSTGPERELPTERVGFVPDFEVRASLGRKNTRSMDRATGLAVLTVGMLLEGDRAAGRAFDGDAVGLVLGTTTGSVQSMTDFTRDSLTGDKPYHVDPARFPNTVMNCAAGQSAIWHGLRGPNTTVAGGATTALTALSYAARLHRSERARTVICGAVEELGPQRAWLEARGREDEGATALGEGCAVFRLESAEYARTEGRGVLAELLAVRLGVSASPEQTPDALADCATAALAEAVPGDPDRRDAVWAVAADLDPAALAPAAALLPGVRHIELASRTGDTGAASGALLLAAVLSYAQEDSAAAGRVALLLSADRDGLYGCAVLRMSAGEGR
jgi:3-oxoacyl-[acyl-carrier-protein] synthase II